MLVGRTRPTELEQAVDEQRRLLHVAPEQKKRARIYDIHHCAVRKVERRAEHPLDRSKARQEFPKRRLKRHAHLSTLEAHPAQFLAATVHKGGDFRDRLIMRTLDRKAEPEESEIGLKIRVVLRQHQLLHLADVR